MIHQHGGQVYLDGANMNAQVGLTNPAIIGADVCHLNLHKTFAIPHGGGGPGMGPIGVKSHLQPYLPKHYTYSDAKIKNSVAAAPFSSASLLAISWMYITTLGKTGLRRATQIAILTANYIASKLSKYYPILYTGNNGKVAHECIIDIRPIKKATGISEEDIAKRLMDYSFHAPTMSFPVLGTLMIEPTESESLAELDRFINAMIAIKNEIIQVETGTWPKDNNPLVNAPHSIADLIDENWNYPYTKQQAVFPLTSLQENKFWPSVNRVDNAKGDRNLICTCPDINEYL
jgi:glycine dehydrogenase